MRLVKNIIWFSILALVFWACTQDDDGPLSLMTEKEIYTGEGYFLHVDLDSGKMMHLVGDTLFMHMDSIWSFSNCALQRIGLESERGDSVLVLLPRIYISEIGEDCPAPFYRPDTTVRVNIEEGMLRGVSQIKVKNNRDSILDSILVRRGEITHDSILIFVDTLFDSVKTLPRRTKDSPSIFRVVDSLTPRVYYWRPMKSDCKMLVDNCELTVKDTIYPTYWSLNDTVLVPIRTACADTDEVYCLSTKWENDSSSLGEVVERHDTLWHTSTYYMEKIPDCSVVDKFSISTLYTGKKVTVVRNLFVPDSLEKACGPSTRKDLFMYSIEKRMMVPDTVNVDSLYKKWKKAKVGKTK